MENHAKELKKKDPANQNSYMTKISFKNEAEPTAAQRVGHPPANEVTSSTPGQGTYLGFCPGPQCRACRKQLIDVSLPLILSPFPSL